MKVHTISYTALDAPGGVPRFNRYLHKVLSEAGHEVKHWCWEDAKVPQDSPVNFLPEYVKADFLTKVLSRSRSISRDDVIIGDGFWCGDLSVIGYRKVISVAHGIWGHVTHQDVLSGKQPENPDLHAAQIAHRLAHRSRGLPIVAVSKFISDEIKLQFGIESTVVNNAIDRSEIPPLDGVDRSVNKFWIVHGINDPGNVNKGWDHIEACKRRWNDFNDVVFLSLDELHERLGFDDKMQTMQHADCVLIPSGFEGNSYFALEAMNCDVPIVGYDVGLLYEIDRNPELPSIGAIADRNHRSPETTADAFSQYFLNKKDTWSSYVVQIIASFDKFRDGWVKAVEDICR